MPNNNISVHVFLVNVDEYFIADMSLYVVFITSVCLFSVFS